MKIVSSYRMGEDVIKMLLDSTYVLHAQSSKDETNMDTGHDKNIASTFYKMSTTK